MPGEERLELVRGLQLDGHDDHLPSGTAPYEGSIGRTAPAGPATREAPVANRQEPTRGPHTGPAQDRELYLPKSWIEDRERCRAARIPEGKVFATKPELARVMVRRALDSALPIAWVTADAAYGQEWHFRRMLEEAGVGYVLAVPKSQQVKSPAGSWRIDHVLTGAPAEAWERIPCGDGAKGPRVYD
ncbi:hypothetical protein ABIA32_005345 [Streptacidiphilus sp. MAP12-20]|uniref:transposase n=1 Tax=Streptacidiphilus sp. MAP12-20 TaxID=3156299 RepID=UPI00351355EB